MQASSNHGPEVTSGGARLYDAPIIARRSLLVVLTGLMALSMPAQAAPTAKAAKPTPTAKPSTSKSSTSAKQASPTSAKIRRRGRGKASKVKLVAKTPRRSSSLPASR